MDSGVIAFRWRTSAMAVTSMKPNAEYRSPLGRSRRSDFHGGGKIRFQDQILAMLPQREPGMQ
jgi:hypothetical protein